MSSNLTGTAISALRWNYVGFLTRSVASFGIGILLARLLGPRPFGQLAAASLVYGLVNLLSDAGFSAALVQAAELTERQIRFTFTIQVLIAAGMTAAALLGARYLAMAFHDPAIQPVLMAISPLFLLQSFGQTAAGLLKRKLAFRALQTAQVSSYLCSYLLVGVPAAYLGAGVWSLVAAQLSQTLLYSAQVYARARHSLVPCFTLSGARLLWFGTKTVGNNIVNWGTVNLDNVFVGHAFGSTSLGLYSRAYNLASIPADGIVTTCQQVLFASCSRASDRLDVIRRAYLSSVGALALLLFPIFWSVAACAETTVIGLYGEQWRSAAALFRPLALAITLHALMAAAGPILAAMDHVECEVRAQTLSALFAVAAFAVATRYSAVALAWAVLLVYVFRFGAVTRQVMRLLNIGWHDIVRVTRGAIIAGAFTSAAAILAEYGAMRCGIEPGYRLIVLAFVGSVCLFAALAVVGEIVLPRELVSLLLHPSLRLPKALAGALEHINARHVLSAQSGIGA